MTGFGFDSGREHHFTVVIPKKKTAPVEVWELFVYRPDGKGEILPDNRCEGECRVVLSREKWERVKPFVTAYLNEQLKSLGLGTVRFKTGQTPVQMQLGKDLTVLLWGIQDASDEAIPQALVNWNGLGPVGLRWLYTMTSQKGPYSSGSGWRMAIRSILTENPVTPESVAKYKGE